MKYLPMDNKAVAKTGNLICVDCYSYSDLSVLGFYVVLKDFSPHDELQKYLNIHPPEEMCGLGQYSEHYYDQHKFLSTLIQNGFLLYVNFKTLSLGEVVEDLKFS